MTKTLKTSSVLIWLFTLILLSTSALGNNESGHPFLWYDEFNSTSSWTTHYDANLVSTAYRGENYLYDQAAGVSGIYLDSQVTIGSDWCMETAVETPDKFYPAFVFTNGNFGASASGIQVYMDDAGNQIGINPYNGGFDYTAYTLATGS